MLAASGGVQKVDGGGNRGGGKGPLLWRGNARVAVLAIFQN